MLFEILRLISKYCKHYFGDNKHRKEKVMSEIFISRKLRSLGTLEDKQLLYLGNKKNPNTG